MVMMSAAAAGCDDGASDAQMTPVSAGQVMQTASPDASVSAGTPTDSTAPLPVGGQVANPMANTGGMMSNMAGMATAGQPADNTAGTPSGGQPAAGGQQPATGGMMGVEELPEPMAVAPCGDSIDVMSGRVRPNLGTVVAQPRNNLDPSADGAFQVMPSDYSVGANDGFELALRVFMPTADGMPLPQRLPLVIALPGRGFTFNNYTHMTSHLASHGFIVIGANVADTGFNSPAEHDKKARRVTDVLNWALNESPLANNIDPNRIGAMGHSAGAKVAFYAAAQDPRIDLVVAWDPQNGGGPPCFLGDVGGSNCNDFPVAPNCMANDPGLIHQIRAESLIFGAEDGLLTPDVHLRANQFYRGAPSPTHFVLMPAVGHGAWTAAGATSILTRGIHTAFFLSRMTGMNDLDEWLPGGQRLIDDPSITDVRSK